MKKSLFNQSKIVFAFLAIIALAGTSCKKYLDQYPVQGETYIDVFSTNEKAFKALLGVYGVMGGDAGYGSRISLYYPLDTDEAMVSGNLSGARREIGHYVATPATPDIEAPFNQLFRGIDRANVCIYYIPQMSGFATDPETRRMYGEALTLRAQYYTELIRNWGDVPARYLPSNVTTDAFLPRANRDEIYDKLLEDLKEAQNFLPWRKDVSYGERVTKGTAKALRARIAMYRGGYSLRNDSEIMERRSDYQKYYQIALDECKSIVDDPGANHRLNPSFKSIFKSTICAKTGDPTGEVIFMVGLGGASGASGGGKVGQYNGPKSLGGSGSGGGILILPTAFYEFDSTDKRRDISMAPYDVETNGNKKGVTIVNIRDGKYRKEWVPIDPTTDPSNIAINYPLIRYSDVLLMLAEAENELNGPTALAKSALQQVRARAFGVSESDASIAAPSDKLLFFDAVVKERMLEFFAEGVRKYDLIRWNLLETKLNETKVNLTKMANAEAPYDQIPKKMYFKKNNASDEFDLWINSFYHPGPTSSTFYPEGTQVDWSNPSTINGNVLAYYAVGFIKNHKELLPIHNNTRLANYKFTQNPNY